MDEITKRRSLVFILVIATVAIFVGLVWLIATYVPWNLLIIPNPSDTAVAAHEKENCTYPISYWKEHPELFPPQIVLGSKVYQAKDIGVILSYESQDTTTLLQTQLVGVFLNILSGADQSPIEATIFQAYEWLALHPDGSQVSDSESGAGSRLYNVLEAYNSGLTDIRACQNASALSTVVSSTSLSPTGLASLTPSSSGTPTPSATSSPTGQATSTIRPGVTQTRTPIPTTEEPGIPPSTPTRTRTPSIPLTPTLTKAVPTRTNTQPNHTPTNTPRPPNTPTTTPVTPATLTVPPPPPATITPTVTLTPPSP